MKTSKKIILSLLVLLSSQANVFAGCGISKVAPVENAKFVKVAPIEEVVSKMKDFVLEDIEESAPVKYRKMKFAKVAPEEFVPTKLTFNDLSIWSIADIISHLEQDADVLSFALVSKICFDAAQICNEDLKKINNLIIALAKSDISYLVKHANSILRLFISKNYPLLIKEFFNKLENKGLSIGDIFSERAIKDNFNHVVQKRMFKIVKILLSYPEILKIVLEESINIGRFGNAKDILFCSLGCYNMVELLLQNPIFFDSLTECDLRVGIVELRNSRGNSKTQKLLEMAIKLKRNSNWREEATTKFAGKKRK